MSLADWARALDWRDLFDILLVAVIIYYLLLLIRGTRAVQILLGILFLGAVSYLAGLGDLVTVEWLLRGFLTVLPFAIIVLFQQEIRRALANFGRNPLWGLNTQKRVQSSIQEIELAAGALSARRWGALIVVQRLEGLRNYIENGIVLDAELSYNLLINVFDPDTPLHDGAVIVQQDRIAAAACFLPLVLRPGLADELGTRHRAAIGISEETDALAVVVSEETGTISVAIGGELHRGLAPKSLRNELYRYLITDLNTGVGRKS